jgi:hypothetical protein
MGQSEGQGLVCSSVPPGEKVRHGRTLAHVYSGDSYARVREGRATAGQDCQAGVPKADTYLDCLSFTALSSPCPGGAFWELGVSHPLLCTCAGQRMGS